MPSPPTSAPFRPTLELIVIEDSADDYELLLARLRAAGRSVNGVRVETADELARELARGGWSAVIADHRLPRFTSLEALKIVRNGGDDLPFLIVSGAIGEEVAVEAMRAGADDYLMKDKLGRLEPALDRAIEAAASRRHRREAEAALAESEERFRALTANLPGMVFQLTVDAHGEMSVIYVSEGSRRLLGVSAQDFVADPLRALAPVSKSDIESLCTRFRRAPSTTVPPGWLEFTAQIGAHEAGRPRWIEVTARVRRLASGRLLWDGIAIDITPQKRAEEDLRASREELRELSSHQARVREEERATIAREIHDDIGSTITGVKFKLAWLKGQRAADAELAQQLGEMDQLVDAVIASSTRIMHNLRPGILDEGIVAALDWQARTFQHRTGVACLFVSSHDEIALGPDSAIVVFRVCQEALNNIAKHAGASRVDVNLVAADGELVLEVVDDGRGVARADVAKRGHYGLRGMRERALALGGAVDIAKGPRGGTAITLRIPMQAPPIEPASRARVPS
jgi:PAS domain S-box-containing protein